MEQKQQVFYIHGGTAFSDYAAFLNFLKVKTIRDLPNQEVISKWSEHLSADLGAKYEVFAPAMPNSQNAKYQEWKIWFERHFEYLRDNLVLLGWSQGGLFLIKYLLENDFPFTIKKLILVAAPFSLVTTGGEDGGDFNFATEMVGDLVNKAQNIDIFHSEDDFVVPFSEALRFKAAWPKAELITFTDRNHFLIPTFPELIASIKA
jgi:uncharacterized protein